MRAARARARRAGWAPAAPRRRRGRGTDGRVSTPARFLGREARRIEGQRLPPADGGDHEVDGPGHLGALDAFRALAVDGRGGVRQVAVVVGHQGRERAGAVEDGALDEELGLDLHRVAHRADDGRPLHVVVARGGELGLDAEQRAERTTGRRDQQDVVGAPATGGGSASGRAGPSGRRASAGPGPRCRLGCRGRPPRPPRRAPRRASSPTGSRRAATPAPTGSGACRRQCRARPTRLDSEVERGRLQDARHRQGHRLVEGAGGRVAQPELLETAALPGRRGACGRPVGRSARGSPTRTLPSLGRRQRRPSAAGEERRRHEGERREVHGRQMQLFHLVGRRRLPLGDALEALGTGLRREPPRPHRRGRRRREDTLARLAPGADAVGEGGARRPPVAVAGKAEQVGDGVVVLGRGQGERGGVRRGSGHRRGRLAARRSCRQELEGGRGQSRRGQKPDAWQPAPVRSTAKTTRLRSHGELLRAARQPSGGSAMARRRGTHIGLTDAGEVTTAPGSRPCGAIIS